MPAIIAINKIKIGIMESANPAVLFSGLATYCLKYTNRPIKKIKPIMAITKGDQNNAEINKDGIRQIKSSKVFIWTR